MNFSKPKTNGSQPVVRKTTVRVPVTNSANSQLRQPPARPDPNRFQTALNRKSTLSNKPPIPAQRALSVARGVKRKSATPQPERPLFSDDEGDDSSDVGGSDSDVSRKRIKSSVSSEDSTGPRRNVVCDKAFQEGSNLNFGIIHGAQATSGAYASKFENQWKDDDVKTVALRYPSRSFKEKFELKKPKHKTDYKPMDDITETIQTVCKFYFPPELSAKYLNDDDGFGRRFTKADTHQDVDEWAEVVDQYNKVMQTLLDDGTIKTRLTNQPSISFDWAKRILDQIYARTVSPKVEMLTHYQNGTDAVYGELLPRFCTKIFKQTKLTHEQIFVDLGSGVGNAVLQAALEVGCESWGIEKEKNPCDLAELQADEFKARTPLWGVSTGTVALLRGDFTENRTIAGILQRADVVLVNNQAFQPALNEKLRDMFYDLKEGCQIVSLKPFVPSGWKLNTRNYSSIVGRLVQTRYEYFSNNVSWTDNGGEYFIARVDSRPLRRFMEANGLS